MKIPEIPRFDRFGSGKLLMAVPTTLIASMLMSTSIRAASPIPITNPSFDESAVSPPVGWTDINGGADVFVATTTQYNPLTLVDGPNFASAFGGTAGDGLSQTLTATLQADATYVLTVQVGDPADAAFDGYIIQLLANGTLLAQDDNTQTPADGAFAAATATYVYDPGDAALVGQPLEIRLLSKGLSSGDVNFDKVELSVALANPVAVPGGPYNVFPGDSLSLDGSGSLPSDGETITTYEWDLNNDNTFGDVTGATPAAITDTDLIGTWGMTLGAANPIQLRVTDSAAKTSTVSGTVNLQTTPPGSLSVDFQATIASEQHPTYAGEARFFHVSTNPANPGTGSYAATIVGTNNPAPPFVRNFDGPVLAYKFAGGTNNDINAVAQQGGTLGGGIITFTTTDIDGFDGFGQQQAKLWTTTDPGSDLKVAGADPYNVAANTNSTGGWRSLSNATGKIDVTSIPAGSLHIYYGAFSAKPSVSVVMRDTALVNPAPDITIPNAHLNDDTADRTEYYLAEIDFVTDGVYDEIEFVWNSGSTNGRGIAVVVTEAVADAVAPTLAPADIVDNVSGGPFISTGAPITYTVTYSELMDPATIDASDFGLSGTASGTIDSVVHYGGVTTVVVTPTLGTSGTLVLEVNAGAVLADLAGNTLDTTVAIADDPAVAIVSDVTAPTLVSITDNVSGGPVLEGQTVVYTVTFDEPIKASSIGTDDFENGGSPAGVISAVNPTANPAVYEVLASSAYPGGVGTLLLQIKSGAVIEDLSGNPLDTSSALADDVTITVNAQEARLVPTVDLPAASAENTSATLTLTYDASGSDKLVINATKEGNSNPYTTLTYEGQPLTLAVSTGSTAGNQHWNGIYYLDNPGSYDNGSGPVGEIVATSGSSRNVITAVGLSNTAPGVGATAAPPAPDNSKSVSIGLSYVNSAVIAAHGMGQDGNTANVTSVNTISPLIEIAGSALENGNNWVGHVTGYAVSQGPGFATYSFTGGSTTGVNTIAAEFPGALVSAATPYETWVGGTGTGFGFGEDKNGDGVTNGMAFLLGAADPDANALGLLPTPTDDGSGGLVMSFTMRDSASRGNAALSVQWSSDLGVTDPWSGNVASVPDATPDPQVAPVDFQVTGSGTLSVVATISSTEAVDGKLFGRLIAAE